MLFSQPSITWIFLFTFVLNAKLVRCNNFTQDVFNKQSEDSFNKDYYTTQFNSPHQLFKEKKPNIILILTDDQDVELGSLNFMPKTLRRIRNEGAELRHAYVTTPMCCPSRSSLLTGRYVHNHQVFTNNDNCSSPQWQRDHEPQSFATYLSNAGYRTGYFGKYLNKYNGSYIPPGWREWGGLIMNSRYYNYSVNVNGRKIKHGYEYCKDYYPDLIANDSITFLRESKNNMARKPIMLVASFPAPHGPEDSAPQFSHLFFNVTTHHTPAYDYAPNPDKQWILQVTKKMQPIHKEFTDMLMTKRLQTLQSVDEAVERIYQELKALGILDNTYIIYTSDHGYHLGQFGLIKGKSFPFEFDVRVPFLIRGPGIEHGSIIEDIVLNIDLAPTFLDIAGVDIPLQMDGRSFKKLLYNKHGRKLKQKWPDTFLIESSGRRETAESFTEMKTREVKKQYFNGIQQLLNMTIKNKISNLSYSKTEASPEGKKYTDSKQNIADDKELTGHLSENTNSSLNSRVHTSQSIHNSKHERMKFECSRPEAQANCVSGQKWRCEKTGHWWRRHKCRHLMPATPVQNELKKCACFTPKGVVYTRLNTNNFIEQAYISEKKIRRNTFIRDINSVRLYREKPVSSSKKLLPIIISPYAERHKCYCVPDLFIKRDVKDNDNEEKRKLKEERLRKKEKKSKKKGKLEKECIIEKMNCFEHNNDHWRTEPFWKSGPFCFCMNANNNSYSCIRTINATHNFLYCEFTTGLITFYNLRIDPFEQWNRISSLSSLEKLYLHNQLEHLKACKGTQDCTVGNAKEFREQHTELQRHFIQRKFSKTSSDFTEKASGRLHAQSSNMVRTMALPQFKKRVLSPLSTKFT